MIPTNEDLENETIARNLVNKLKNAKEFAAMKRSGTLDRNLSIWAERKYGKRTYNDIGRDHKVTAGLIEKLYKKMDARIRVVLGNDYRG